MIIAGKTDIGQIRAENQDTWRAGRRADGTGWALVCDGMGGARAGGLASRTAAGSMEQQLWEAAPREAENGGAVLAEAVSQANLAVYQRAQEGGSSTYGMGTTIAAVLVRGRDVFYAHVGDSRIYLCRGGILVQLTRDHSRVQEMVEAGVITQQQAKVHPKRNQITRALGVGPQVQVDVGSIPVQPGDCLLLCSDGLSNQLTEQQLTGVLSDTEVHHRPAQLIQLANQAGGPDNITAVVVQITEEELNG